MKAPLTKVSLALLSAVFILSCQDLGTGPDGLVPQFDKPIGNCAVPVNGHCHDDDENSDNDTFTVEVFFDGNIDPAGSFPNAVAIRDLGLELGKEGGKNNTMTLNLGLVNTGLVCDTDFGSATGQFAIHVAKTPKSSPVFTLVSATFFNFEVNGDGVNRGLGFPKGTIDYEPNWLPADPKTNSMRGTALNLRGEKNGPCNGSITQGWQIRVTKN